MARMLFSKRSRRSAKESGGSALSPTARDVKRKYESAGMDVFGECAHDLRNCVGAKRIGHAVVTGAPARRQHLRLGEAKLCCCGRL